MLYILPPDIVNHVNYKDGKGPIEYRFTIQNEQMRTQYEAAIGKFLAGKKLLGKGATIRYSQLTNMRDVANLVNKDTTSLVLIVHGPEDAPKIATHLGPGTDAINAGDFAKLLSGSGVQTTTILGCDAVTNKFAPNLANVLPAGGTVKAFAGHALQIMAHTVARKSKPGVLTLTKLYTKSPMSMSTLKTKGP